MNLFKLQTVENVLKSSINLPIVKTLQYNLTLGNVVKTLTHGYAIFKYNNID